MSGLGLLLGLAVAPLVADYASADPSALWRAAGVTAAFVAATGAYGYATRRDLGSRGPRTLFSALLGLIAFGIAAIFVSIPAENVIYAVAGLVISARSRSSTSNAFAAAPLTPPCRSRPGSSSTSSTSSC